MSVDESKGKEKAVFEIGDVVKLRSGGPWMTITRALNELFTHYEVRWFDSDGEAFEDHFPGDALVLVKDQNGRPADQG